MYKNCLLNNLFILLLIRNLVEDIESFLHYNFSFTLKLVLIDMFSIKILYYFSASLGRLNYAKMIVVMIL